MRFPDASSVHQPEVGLPVGIAAIQVRKLWVLPDGLQTAPVVPTEQTVLVSPVQPAAGVRAAAGTSTSRRRMAPPRKTTTTTTVPPNARLYQAHTVADVNTLPSLFPVASLVQVLMQTMIHL